MKFPDQTTDVFLLQPSASGYLRGCVSYDLPVEITRLSTERMYLVVSTCKLSCGPVGIRTPNLLIRSQMLYPVELRVRCA